jgi:hypothetical protein
MRWPTKPSIASARPRKVRVDSDDATGAYCHIIARFVLLEDPAAGGARAVRRGARREVDRWGRTAGPTTPHRSRATPDCPIAACRQAGPASGRGLLDAQRQRIDLAAGIWPQGCITMVRCTGRAGSGVLETWPPPAVDLLKGLTVLSPTEWALGAYVCAG